MLALVCRPHVPHLRCVVGKVVQVPHQSLPGTALQEFEALGPGEKLGMVQLRGQGCCWRQAAQLEQVGLQGGAVAAAVAVAAALEAAGVTS